MGHYESEKNLLRLAEIANEYANAISAINTLQAKVIDTKGQQALPGKNRLKSGIAGQAIKWAGIDMVKNLKKIRMKNNFKFEIVGVGGVTTPADYLEYIESGADCVMSATGAMWNPYLAKETKEAIGLKVHEQITK